MTFGKFKGMTISQIHKHPKGENYIKWLLSQDWFENHPMYKHFSNDSKSEKTNSKTEAIKILNRLKHKADSYNNQDIKAGRLLYNDKYKCYNYELLTHIDIIDILKSKGAKCYYCNKNTLIMPRYPKDGKQFTLDRINNNLPHTTSNLIVCCWSCNELRSDKYTVEEFKKIKSFHK